MNLPFVFRAGTHLGERTPNFAGEHVHQRECECRTPIEDAKAMLTYAKRHVDHLLISKVQAVPSTLDSCKMMPDATLAFTSSSPFLQHHTQRNVSLCGRFRARGRFCARTPVRIIPRATGGSSASTSTSTKSEPSDFQRALPTLLTLVRVACTPVVAALYMCGFGVSAAVLFALCSLTDLVDGILARKWDVCTPLGAFLDPVADKLLVCAALVCTAAKLGIVPLAAAAAAIATREIYVSALREWMAERNVRNTVQVGMLGKFKTAAQMVATCALLAAPTPPAATNSMLAIVGTAGAVVAAVLGCISAAQYTIAALPDLLKPLS